MGEEKDKRMELRYGPRKGGMQGEGRRELKEKRGRKWRRNKRSVKIRECGGKKM